MEFSNDPCFNIGSDVSVCIARAMARAFFMSAFADAYDDAHDDCPERARIGSMCGRDFRDVLPEQCDPGAESAAQELCEKLEKENGRDLFNLYYDAQEARVFRARLKNMTPENFGHFLAMQSMGHGVGLEELGDEVRNHVIVPDVEFSWLSLEREYFTPSLED